MDVVIEKQIEMEIFKNVMKDVEKQNGFDWTGTLEENISADIKVAASIRSSLYNYEKEKQKDGQQYVVVK